MKTIQFRVTLPVSIVEQLTEYASARHRTPRDVLVQLIGEHCVESINAPLIRDTVGKVGRPAKGRPRVQAFYLGRLWSFDADEGGWCPANISDGASSVDYSRLGEFRRDYPDQLEAIREALRMGAGGTWKDARLTHPELFDDDYSPHISEDEQEIAD